MGEAAVEDLTTRLSKLEWELQLMHRIISAKSEAKSPAAWDNAERLGAKISKEWKLKIPSWKAVSEQRR